MIRRINKNEFAKVISFANEQFLVDFKSVHPAIYGDSSNYKYHYIYEENNEIIGMFLAKPLIYKEVSFLGIGTLCVRKDMRNHNVMQEMFKYIKNNLEKEYDVIYLLGDRKRYENFNFFKFGTFANVKVKSKYITNSIEEVKIQEIKDINNQLFAIIKKYDCVKREKDTVLNIYKGSNNTLYLVSEKKSQSIVIYNKINNEIINIFGNVNEEKVIKKVINNSEKEYVNIFVDYSKMKTLYELSDKYIISNMLSLKIINYPKVIKKLFVYEGNRYGTLELKLAFKTISISYIKGILSVDVRNEINQEYMSESEISNILFGNLYFNISSDVDINLVTSWFPLSISNTLVNIDGV